MNKNDYLLSLYQSAINQSNHEGDLIWQKFNAFIVTHGILFALMGGVITTNGDLNKNILVLSISAVGFLLCLLWLISTIRGYETLEYWKSTGIELASKIFKNSGLLNYYERGYEYFMDYDQVSFDYGYKKSKLQRNCLSKMLKFINTRRTAYFSIGIIIIVYIATFSLILKNPSFIFGE